MSDFVTLGDHITIQKGKAPLATGYSGPGAKPYLNPEYLRGRSSAELVKPGSDAVHARDGDTILLWDGSNAGEFFKAKSGLAASTMATITPDTRFNSAYFFHVTKHAETYLKSQTNGTGIPHVDRELLEAIRVFCPAPAEQLRLAEILDHLDTAIHETEAIIVKLKAVKHGLLQDLLTRGIDANGELRPPRTEASHLYKESPLGWIPIAWDVELLDDVALRGSGHTPSKSVPSYWNGGIKWVSLADSHRLDAIFINDTDKEISEQGIANSSAVLHPAGTVVLSRDAGIGKSAVLGSDMAVSQHFIAWRCGRRMDNLFLYFYLQREKPKFEAIAMGSTIKTIGLPFFKTYRVAIPPLEEQVQAASILINAELGLINHVAELEKLRNLKLGLLDDLLTGRVRVTPLLAEATHQQGSA